MPSFFRLKQDNFPLKYGQKLVADKFLEVSLHTCQDPTNAEQVKETKCRILSRKGVECQRKRNERRGYARWCRRRGGPTLPGCPVEKRDAICEMRDVICSLQVDGMGGAKEVKLAIEQGRLMEGSDKDGPSRYAADGGRSRNGVLHDIQVFRESCSIRRITQYGRPVANSDFEFFFSFRAAPDSRSHTMPLEIAGSTPDGLSWRNKSQTRFEASCMRLASGSTQVLPHPLIAHYGTMQGCNHRLIRSE